MSTRKRDSKLARLIARDGPACHYCGQVPTERITFDHVLPQSQGGTRRDGNYVLACLGCNQRRGAIHYELFAALNSVDRDTIAAVLQRAHETHALHVAQVPPEHIPHGNPRKKKLKADPLFNPDMRVSGTLAYAGAALHYQQLTQQERQRLAAMTPNERDFRIRVMRDDKRPVVHGRPEGFGHFLEGVTDNDSDP